MRRLILFMVLVALGAFTFADDADSKPSIVWNAPPSWEEDLTALIC